MHLSKVLTIVNGEIKPRMSYQEFIEVHFDGFSPRLNYVDYDRLCRKVGRKLSSQEWAQITWSLNDESPRKVF